MLRAVPPRAGRWARASRPSRPNLARTGRPFDLHDCRSATGLRRLYFCCGAQVFNDAGAVLLGVLSLPRWPDSKTCPKAKKTKKTNAHLVAMGRGGGSPRQRMRRSVGAAGTPESRTSSSSDRRSP
jgi:hypothetical protein